MKKLAQAILAEDVIVPENIMGWTHYEDDTTGVIHWSHPNFKHVEIMASPNWTDDGYTGFDLWFVDDDEFPNFELGKVKNARYESRLRDVIEFVQNKFSK